MNTILTRNQQHTELVYFLSDLIGAIVVVRDRKIGVLRDVAILEHEKLPEVTHLVVGRPFGRKPLLVPWVRVVEISQSKIIIDIDAEEKFEEEPAEKQILLRDYVLDKKIIDMEDNEVDVVYDVKLVVRSGKLYVTDVDFSRYAKLKRLGLSPIAKMLFGSTSLLKRETLSWAYVQHLPENIGRLKGDIKLNVLKEKLSEIHPVDLADILEELDHAQSLAIFEELDTEHASDTLEEIEPRVQRALISSMNKERVADLIDEMTPAQAADVLSVLPAQEADEILKLMEHEEAEKIELLLGDQDDTIANLTTKNFIKFLPSMPVDLVIAAYRKFAEDADVLDYLYVVDHGDRLQGVVSLPELLMAKPETPLKEIMTADIVSINPGDAIAEASMKLLRYGFRALPVLTENGVIIGVVPYRDIVNLKHRFA